MTVFHCVPIQLLYLFFQKLFQTFVPIFEFLPSHFHISCQQMIYLLLHEGSRDKSGVNSVFYFSASYCSPEFRESIHPFLCPKLCFYFLQLSDCHYQFIPFACSLCVVLFFSVYFVIEANKFNNTNLTPYPVPPFHLVVRLASSHCFHFTCHLLFVSCNLDTTLPHWHIC